MFLLLYYMQSWTELQKQNKSSGQFHKQLYVFVWICELYIYIYIISIYVK